MNMIERVVEALRPLVSDGMDEAMLNAWLTDLAHTAIDAMNEDVILKLVEIESRLSKKLFEMCGDGTKVSGHSAHYVWEAGLVSANRAAALRALAALREGE